MELHDEMMLAKVDQYLSMWLRHNGLPLLRISKQVDIEKINQQYDDERYDWNCFQGYVDWHTNKFYNLYFGDLKKDQFSSVYQEACNFMYYNLCKYVSMAAADEWYWIDGIKLSDQKPILAACTPPAQCSIFCPCFGHLDACEQAAAALQKYDMARFCE